MRKIDWREKREKNCMLRESERLGREKKWEWWVMRRKNIVC